MPYKKPATKQYFSEIFLKIRKTVIKEKTDKKPKLSGQKNDKLNKIADSKIFNKI